ncbi:3687_t:CDS:2 [Paraglomus occultum]|uniref:3687_t:CDS:1 n=1 Tax=Paraglomus occultum TaxID=144539 RepID=A0A9N9FNU8_9GLOM|nr:3687_t:CDS:2 [Paraglomus occultum]
MSKACIVQGANGDDNKLFSQFAVNKLERGCLKILELDHVLDEITQGITGKFPILKELTIHKAPKEFATFVKIGQYNRLKELSSDLCNGAQNEHNNGSGTGGYLPDDLWVHCDKAEAHEER